ncbi:MAG: hypothetical protein JXN61_00755 [Sedimentisphaerales bacterium]|nr:hypothetical protein [Sedimentisphaerales bacterium]
MIDTTSTQRQMNTDFHTLMPAKAGIGKSYHAETQGRRGNPSEPRITDHESLSREIRTTRYEIDTALGNRR